MRSLDLTVLDNMTPPQLIIYAIPMYQYDNGYIVNGYIGRVYIGALHENNEAHLTHQAH